MREQHAHVGWLLDGSGAPAQRSVLLSWRGGTIATLGTVGGEALPEGTLGLQDCTALPGLVDAHVHLALEATTDPDQRRAQLTAEYDERCPIIEGHLRQHRSVGVAAVRDGGDYGGFALRYRDETSPDNLPVVLRSAGRAWRAQGRYGRLIGRPVPAGTTLAAALTASSENVDHVKIAQSGVNSLKRYGHTTRPQFAEADLAAAVGAAHRLGRPVMIHANGPDPVASAIRAGCDSIEHGYFATVEVLKRTLDAGAVWVPTLAPLWAVAETGDPRAAETVVAKRTFEHQLEQVARAAEAGVRIAAGTDAGAAGVDHGAGLWLELWLLTQAGLSSPEVVRAAAGASLIGDEGRGTLEPGGPATWLAVPGPPDSLFARPDQRPRLCVVEGQVTHAP